MAAIYTPILNIDMKVVELDVESIAHYEINFNEKSFVPFYLRLGNELRNVLGLLFEDKYFEKRNSSNHRDEVIKTTSASSIKDIYFQYLTILHLIILLHFGCQRTNSI